MAKSIWSFQIPEPVPGIQAGAGTLVQCKNAVRKAFRRRRGLTFVEVEDSGHLEAQIEGKTVAVLQMLSDASAEHWRAHRLS